MKLVTLSDLISYGREQKEPYTLSSPAVQFQLLFGSDYFIWQGDYFSILEIRVGGHGQYNYDR